MNFHFAAQSETAGELGTGRPVAALVGWALRRRGVQSRHGRGRLRRAHKYGGGCGWRSGVNIGRVFLMR